MKSIQIREAPSELYSILRETAEKEGRSLSQQALAFMAMGANVALNSAQRRKTILKDFRPIKVSKKFSAVSEIASDRKR